MDTVPRTTRPTTPPLSHEHWLAIYRSMVAAREVDVREAELVSNGEAFFHVSGAGHEGIAVLNACLKAEDWLHCHYRDKALMLGRGVTPEMFFHSSLCNAASHSAGRQMSAHMSDPALHLLSLVGPVGNNALQAVGVAAEVRDQPEHPIVLCAVGDGTSQQGEFLEAVAEAVREGLRVLFLVENNGYSISTRTAGQTWFDLPTGPVESFYGLPILRLDGRNPQDCHGPMADCVAGMRADNCAAIVVFNTERLANHTNADDERVYRTPSDIDTARRTSDPILNLRLHLEATGVDAAELDALETEIRADVSAAANRARAVEDPVANLDARAPLPAALADRTEHRGHPDAGPADVTMLKAIRQVLEERLATDPRVSLFGEDLEDPKGDVFGLTKGLSTRFPGRVCNSPLAESTIVGKSIGRALAGGRPVAFLQFADFLPIAYNQIISELGSMHWRSDGGWTAPVIIMAPCGGYRPGLGPFHAHTMESICVHVPGVDVVMPSTAADAVGLLQAAFASERPTIFLYPKVCLNDRARATTPDTEAQYVPLGSARHLRRGSDLTLVTYGSTVLQCELAADALAAHGIGVDLLDLRSLSPWDHDAVRASAARSGRLIVVHEDNRSCSMASEIVADTVEALSRPIQARRVTRPDTFVPCNFSNQLEVLPSYKRILETAAELLDLQVDWELPPATAADQLIVEAQGSSPADQAVTVAAWNIQPGDRVETGQILADMEADKGVFEYSSPAAGIVEDLLVATGVEVPVGTPLLRLRLPGATSSHKRQTREESGIPSFRARPGIRRRLDGAVRPVYLGGVQTVLGSESVANEALAARFGVDAESIFQRTGIRSRPLIGPGEDALTLALAAARRTLADQGLTVRDVDAIVCATTTPLSACPSMACRILYGLCADLGDTPPHEIPAHDVIAACTGYLYALAAAWDTAQALPGSRVLVVTTEVLSTIVDPTDFDTAILFGDAASATLVSSADAPPVSSAAAGPWWRLHRPVLCAQGEPGDALSVGAADDRRVTMNGRKVFSQAVRQMGSMLDRACTLADTRVELLDYIVPHQANGRIIDAIEKRIDQGGSRVLNVIETTGNTSSSSIPIALVSHDLSKAERLGLCAFGGGFTFGAAILERT